MTNTTPARAAVLAATLAMLTTTAPVALAAEAGAPVCGEPVTADVTLTGDLPCGLTVTTAGVTVDLAGYELGGDLVVPGFWEVPERITDVVVRNGSFAPGAGVDIQRWNSVGSQHFTLEDLRFEGGTIAASGSPSLTMRRVTVTGSGTAVQLFRVARLDVHDSVFVDNGTALALDDSAIGEMIGNRLDGNGTGLLWREIEQGNLGSNARIEDNRFRRNGVGIDARPNATANGTRIVGNSFERHQADAVRVVIPAMPGVTFAFFDAYIARNQMLDNGGNGILVRAPDAAHAARLTLAENRVLLNGSYGIDAPGVTDGGRNLGRQNGEPAQCIGVRCTQRP